MKGDEVLGRQVLLNEWFDDVFYTALIIAFSLGPPIFFYLKIYLRCILFFFCFTLKRQTFYVLYFRLT